MYGPVEECLFAIFNFPTFILIHADLTSLHFTEERSPVTLRLTWPEQ